MEFLRSLVFRGRLKIKVGRKLLSAHFYKKSFKKQLHANQKKFQKKSHFTTLRAKRATFILSGKSTLKMPKMGSY